MVKLKPHSLKSMAYLKLLSPNGLSSIQQLKLMTEKFSEVSSHLNHGHWEVEYDDEIIVIDLWDNSYGTCFLVYQSFSPRQLQTEQDSLDFGL